ncbi:phosphate-starvation-inducible PsiE family protein [Streptomyces sp. NPDC085612]|uniref:phosphate-starvation-inducible PsiE family protein n=1 Tax=Streptomyces sp. NPDC085612 TaxID=3365732 RepID=UPI0037D24BE4
MVGASHSLSLAGDSEYGPGRRAGMRWRSGVRVGGALPLTTAPVTATAAETRPRRSPARPRRPGRRPGPGPAFSCRVIRSIQGPYNEETVVLSALDNGLVLFIVAELLHFVRLTIRNQTLDTEPFLVVGLIAGIRKVLIVTAESERSLRWNAEGIELLILAGLILVMATAGYVWRRSTRPGDRFPLQEVRRSPSPEPSPTPVGGS